MKYAQKIKQERIRKKQALIRTCEKLNGHVCNRNIVKDAKKKIKEFEEEYRMTSEEFFYKYECGGLKFFDDDFVEWARCLFIIR